MTFTYSIKKVERGKGQKEFLKTIKCEHYDGEKCLLFGDCSYPYCRYHVTVEDC